MPQTPVQCQQGSLGCDRLSGLTEAEAAQRLRDEGYNELPFARRRSVFTIIYEIVREPMFILLIASGAIYLVLGELQDALLLLGFVFVIIGITFYQERKTDRALEALRDLSSPRAAVIRNGKVRRIPGREVVRGDTVLLTEGDRVPADVVIFESNYLLVDESLLTGESMPIQKTPGDAGESSAASSGTLVVQGQGIAEVVAIGAATELGKIGRILQTAEAGASPLEVETRRLIRNFALVGLSLCLIVVVVYYLTRGNLLHGFLAGITMAMAILPEEIPVVLTVFLALGAWRMSQKHALTRRPQAIQALGSSTVLCVDKTGTLTMNRMALQQVRAGNQVCDVTRLGDQALPEVCHQTVEFGILASQQIPVDPMEVALKELAESQLGNTEHLHGNWSLVREYPLSRELLAMSRVWRSPDGNEYVIAAKGAPEAILDLCHVAPARVTELLHQTTLMADEGFRTRREGSAPGAGGLRVIAVAFARFPMTELPGIQHDFHFEFVGLLGFADPVRPGVAAAVDDCYRAGIRVIMITGDYAGTARNVARQIGLASPDEVVTGRELDRMTDAQLRQHLKTANVFARVVPEQKLRLVNALKANGEVAVMTGDGVNDAPALKSAQVGIAMGGRGTDVAREAAALVLLDDDFSTIVRAVRQGRRIVDNLKKAFAYILGIHVPIAGLSLLPVLFRWPIVLLPVHVVFLELIIDPACSIVFEAEPEEANVMDRPPRRLNEPFFGRRSVGLSMLQGLVVLVIMLGVYAVSAHQGKGELEARTLTFTALIIANLSLILTNRSWSRTVVGTLRTRNAALWWVIGGALGFLALVLYVPSLRQLFRFGILHPNDLLICAAAGLVSVAWFEMLKLVQGRRTGRDRR